MKKKRHIMQEPRTLGEVFAIHIGAEAWGYCRMMDDCAIEVFGIFTRVAGMPNVDWDSNDVERWRVFFFADGRQGDPTIIQVGNVPFANKAEAEMPPTYRDPDDLEPRYTIEERGMYRYTNNPADLKGIAKQVTLVPATLGSFLKEQYHTGALREVGMRKPSI